MCLKSVGKVARPGEIIIGVRRVPTTVKIRWPAQILAVNRKARVSGRISVLRDSTSTRKGAKKSGAPLGMRAPNTLVGANVIPVIRNLAHRGSARGSVMARCAEVVNVYGRSPDKFIVMIMIKRDVRSNGRPGIDLVDENFAEETIGRAKVKSRVFCRALEGHNPGRISIKAANGMLQKRIFDKLDKGLIAGSKDVKRSGVMGLLNSTCKEFSFED